MTTLIRCRCRGRVGRRSHSGGGSPFATGGNPVSVAFCPSSLLFAVANFRANTVSVFSLGPPSAMNSSPGSGGTYAVGQMVRPTSRAPTRRTRRGCPRARIATDRPPGPGRLTPRPRFAHLHRDRDLQDGQTGSRRSATRWRGRRRRRSLAGSVGPTRSGRWCQRASAARRDRRPGIRCARLNNPVRRGA